MSANKLTSFQLLQIKQAAVSISGNSDEWPVLVGAIEAIIGKPLGKKSASWLKEFCQDYLAQQKGG